MSKQSEIEQRLANVEQTLKRCKGCTGGILSSQDFDKRVIHEGKENFEEARRKFETRDWDETLTNNIIITPFEELNITPFSYDLSIGKEVMSLRPKKPVKMPKPWNVEPGQTVAVMTKEYIALPPTYAATVWPRYKLVQEGIFQSMVKIDPTWYGKIAVAMTNVSPRTFTLKEDMIFGTLIVFGLASNSDLYLWKLIELPDEYTAEADVSNVVGLERIAEALAPFRGSAWLDGKTLKVKALKQTDYINLLGIDSSKPWEGAVKKIRKDWLELKHRGAKAIALNGLGMEHLDEIAIEQSKGTPPSIDIHGATPEKLQRAAEDYGIPFDLVCGVPDMILRDMKTRISAEVEATVGKTVYLQVITLVLRVITLLSLVVGLVSLILKAVPGEGQSVEIQKWTIGAIVILAVLLFLITVSLARAVRRQGQDRKAGRAH